MMKQSPKTSYSYQSVPAPKQNRVRVWPFVLLGALVLLLVVFLLLWFHEEDDSSVGSSSIPETDMGDLIYHEPAAENIVMQSGTGYVNNELLVTLDSSNSLDTMKSYLQTIGGEVVGEIPITADYQILLPTVYTQEELESMVEQIKALPYVESASLNYAFETEDSAISSTTEFYPNDKKWNSWKKPLGNNWNMKAIEAPEAWVYRDQMQTVNVGVMDGLIYPYHKDVTFAETPLGDVKAMGEERYYNEENWNGDGAHGVHVAGIIGAGFNNRVGVCGVAPNAKLYGVDFTSPLYYKEEDNEPEYGDGSNLYCYKIALAYLVGLKHCQVINISLGDFSVEDRCNASYGDKKTIADCNVRNEVMADFLKKLRKTSGIEFLICKAAGNDNNIPLVFKKDKEDTYNKPLLLYDEYEKYMNGEFANESEKTREEYDKKFSRYAGKISKENCRTCTVDAQWEMFCGITDPDVKDMIVVVGAAAVAGKHGWPRCKHTGYELADYSNVGSRVNLLAPGGSIHDTKYTDARIYSTTSDKKKYGMMSGTSMATPHVAGVATMIFGIDPTFTAKEVKNILTSTATGQYGSEGYAMLNAKLAVEKAIELRDKKANGEDTATDDTQIAGYTGHLYEVMSIQEAEWESGPISWEQAEWRCAWRGGHLAVIESREENDYLYSEMRKSGYKDAYFGFSDAETEGDWKWVDGTTSSYTNWHAGEANNKDDNENYAMFYEQFQDGTWNDGDGIIDMGDAYICEWDSEEDKITPDEPFTDKQLKLIASALGVPDDLGVVIRQYPKSYWEAAGLWDIYVEITHDGNLVAAGSFDIETGEMCRNLYIYTPN